MLMGAAWRETRLGVRPRVAWPWMWLLPTGYNFLLQAGSIGNDTVPTIYALAAVDFGLRAWESRRLSYLWLSILSAALLTGTNHLEFVMGARQNKSWDTQRADLPPFFAVPTKP